MSVIPQGVREYEIVGENKNVIRLTLFRTYGFMGKENLLYRPGRASGEKIIETLDAQLLKKMSFNCGVTYCAKAFNDSNIANIAKQYNTPIEVKEYSEFLNGRLIFSQIEEEATNDNSLSMLRMEGNLTVSSIKNAEDQDGMIIRLYNGMYKENANGKLIFTKRIKNAYVTNLKEEKIAEVKYTDHEIDLDVLSHCKFVTLYVEL